jgi:hypothetical protein
MPKRYINYEGKRIPDAHSVTVFYCDHCDQPHFVLLDSDDKPFAQAVIDPDFLLNVLAENQKAGNA